VDTNDIDLYLCAKRQIRVSKALSIGLLIAAGILGTAIVLGYDASYLRGAFWACFIGFLVEGREVFVPARVVSRERLLRIIESQINRDPEAVHYLAEHHSETRVA
jgi:hypothetical protein